MSNLVHDCEIFEHYFAYIFLGLWVHSSRLTFMWLNLLTVQPSQYISQYISFLAK